MIFKNNYHAALRSKEESITESVVEKYVCCRNQSYVLILACLWYTGELESVLQKSWISSTIFILYDSYEMQL